TFEAGKTYLLLSKNANRILSNKEGKLALTEDNDDINLSFRISTKDDYYILTDVASGKALDATGGGLSLRDSSGSYEQQWKIVSSGTHDGYYYFYPRSSSSSALTNFSATPTLNGVVGLGTAGKTASCQFAFCFDSKKVNYKPISDESDGSYARWIESKGYKKVETVGLPELYSNEGLADDVVVYTGKNQLTVYASRACDVYIYTLDGRLVRSFGVEANALVDCQLPAGVYLVNGRKMVVE
ncbi:MAG: RICIN domain-containing protein, partial [Paludibacteraceae bacterium]|nr:RICIN domain-containing protein [Paludibacteraceae bacterium]